MRNTVNHLAIRLALGCAAAFIACLFFSNAASASENPHPGPPLTGASHPVPSPGRPGSAPPVAGSPATPPGLIPGLLHSITATASHALPPVSASLDRTLHTAPLLTSLTTTATDRVLTPAAGTVGRLTTSVSGLAAKVTSSAAPALRPLGLTAVPAVTQKTVDVVLGSGPTGPAAPFPQASPAQQTTRPVTLPVTTSSASRPPGHPRRTPVITTTASASPAAVSTPSSADRLSPLPAHADAAPASSRALPLQLPGRKAPVPTPGGPLAQDLAPDSLGSRTAGPGSPSLTAVQAQTLIPLPAASLHESLGYSWLPPSSPATDPDYSPD